VVIYFIDKDFQNRGILIGLPRVKGCHNKENIAETVIPIIRDIIDLTKIEVFYIDNVIVNNIIIQIIYNRFKSNIPDSRKRRVRYLNYIINLIAMVFLFNNDALREHAKHWLSTT
jgi:hypothetical protein